MARFGYDTIGGNTNANTPNFTVVNLATLSQPGSVTELSVYRDGLNITTGPVVIIGTIYADSAGTPGALLGQTPAGSIVAGTAAGWLNLPFSSPVALTSGSYWIGFNSSGVFASWNHYYDTTGASNNLAYVPGPSPPNPYGAPLGFLNQFASIYATYATAPSVMLPMGMLGTSRV